MAVHEDDATELQFPKGMLKSSLEFENKGSDEICSCCKVTLHFPFIQCEECRYKNEGNKMCHLNLCLPCFAKGKEFQSHKSDHNYIIMRDIFPFTPDWKGKEELHLLDTILECGLGNWKDVSRYIPNKSSEECKRHFIQCYIEQDSSKADASLAQTSQPIPYTCGSDDPPRPSPGSVVYQDMGGYSAARGDFTYEFHNDAEDIIQDLDYSLFDGEGKSSLGRELQAALLDMYRWQQGERHLRKRVARNHGLISMSKAQYSLHKYKNSLPGLPGQLIAKLHQLMGHEELNYLIEGLQYQDELAHQIAILKEYRHNGISKLSQASIYKTMKTRRETFFRQGQKLLNQGTDKNIVGGVHTSTLYTMMEVSMKRRSVPLDISSEKDYEKLSQSEKEIAARLRILPTNFLNFKKILINHCIKNDGLLLSQARALLKIDVNKVRKVYNYLISEGCIYPKDHN